MAKPVPPAKPVLTLRQKQALIADAERRLAQECANLLLTALANLTGTQFKTLQQLAQMGHPYALRVFRAQKGKFKQGFGAGTPAPYIINKQSGDMAGGFTAEITDAGEGNFTVTAVNGTKESRFLAEGTSRMIKRPFDVMAAQTVKQQVKRLAEKYQAALRRQGIEVQLRVPQIDFLLDGLLKAKE